MVDSSSSEEELRESRDSLTACLSSPSLSGLPLLLVCSKQDIPTAQSPTQVYYRDVGEIPQSLKISPIPYTLLSVLVVHGGHFGVSWPQKPPLLKVVYICTFW